MDFDIIGVKNSILGEGPIWCAQENCLYYLDIMGRKLHRVEWKTKEVRTKELPQMTGCIAFTKNCELIYAMENGIYNERFELLHKERRIEGIRFNDGKVAPNGIFYVGTIKKEGGGKLYRLNNHSLEVVLEDVRISNGMDWSMDEQTMYYCDTATQKVVSYDFPAMKKKTTVIEIPKSMGSPDGMCIDYEGLLWIALWGGGSVIRVNPSNGRIVHKIDLPVSKVSCPAFAGENLDELVITSASVDTDLKKEPLAGCTFVLKVNTKGRRPYVCTI